jgi:hypothetical protein
MARGERHCWIFVARLRLAWILASCSTIMRSFSAALSLSTAAKTRTLLEVSPSTYGPALLDFGGSAAVLAWIFPLVLDHPGVLFGRPFGAECPRGRYQQRQKLELCRRCPCRRTAPHCWIFVAVLRFWLGFPALADEDVDVVNGQLASLWG